jgi:hypothetical protein
MFMPDTTQREVVESVFERNQRREAEINNALKQEAVAPTTSCASG